MEVSSATVTNGDTTVTIPPTKRVTKRIFQPRTTINAARAILIVTIPTIVEEETVTAEYQVDYKRQIGTIGNRIIKTADLTVIIDIYVIY